MSQYYVITQLLVLAGGFVVLTTFAFSGAAVDAISFGVSVGILLTTIATQLVVPAERRRAHRALAAAGSVVAAWTILVSLGIFSGAAQTWLQFAGGAAVVALAATGGTVATLVRERRLAAVSSAMRPTPFGRVHAR